MLYYYLLYFFIAVGAKLILALIMIYYLLPWDHRCNSCDEQTLLLQTNPVGRMSFWLMRGLIEWRFCPRCGWEGMSRRISQKESPSERRFVEPVS